MSYYWWKKSSQYCDHPPRREPMQVAFLGRPHVNGLWETCLLLGSLAAMSELAAEEVILCNIASYTVRTLQGSLINTRFLTYTRVSFCTCLFDRWVHVDTICLFDWPSNYCIRILLVCWITKECHKWSFVVSLRVCLLQIISSWMRLTLVCS